MKLRFEYKITLVYLFIGAVWILFSDKTLHYFVTDSQTISHIQTYKGFFYVLTTGILLFFFVKRHLLRLRQSEENLHIRNRELECIQKELKGKTNEYFSLLEEYKTQNEDLIVAKENAEKREYNFRLLVENAPDAIFIQTDWKFAYLNKQALRLFGADSTEQLIGKPVMDSFHKDYHDIVKKRITELNENRKKQSIKKQVYIRLDGSAVDVETSGVPFAYKGKNGALVFVRDVSEKSKYIREIEQKNVFIQTILDNLPIGVALNKLNEGTATYMNDKFAEIYGWPVSELKDIDVFFKKVYPDKSYREKIKKQIIRDINSGNIKNMQWNNIIITQKNGENRIVNAVNIPLFEQNIMVSTVIDITQLKQKEAELIKAKEKAQESNALKTAFMNNVSHEFRTPVNGILGFSQLILKPGISPVQKRRYVDYIKQSCDRLLSIVTDTIEISHIQSNQAKVKRTNCDLAAMFDDLNEFMRIETADKNVEFNVILKNSNLNVHTDCHKLFRSVKHLLDNAAKFTQNGAIDLIYHRTDENVRFTVRDTGIGIAPENQTIIFEPFRQLELGMTRNYDGNGVGLSLVKAYTEMLNGSIDLKSDKGEGTTISLTIPIKPSGKTEKTAKQDNNQSLRFKSSQIKKPWNS